jgi:Carboxypeptidase regulatory-like domain
MPSFRRSLLPLFLGMLLLCVAARFPIAAQAQTLMTAAGGTVRGTDERPIAGATITLSGNGTTRRATSDPTGRFEFVKLAPG